MSSRVIRTHLGPQCLTQPRGLPQIANRRLPASLYAMAAQDKAAALLAEVKEHLASTEVHPNVIDMVISIRKATTLPKLANAFADRADIDAFLKAQQVTAPEEVGFLAMAWREAESAYAGALAKRTREENRDIDDEDPDAPITAKILNPLTAEFKTRYNMSPIATWTGPKPLLNRLYKEFKNGTHTAVRIVRIQTLEGTQDVIHAQKKTKVGPGTQLLTTINDPFTNSIHVWNTAGFLTELKIICWSMGLAGCWIQKDTDKIFAPLEPLLNHLAKAEAFVLKHLNGRRATLDIFVLDKVRAVDETIRAEWARRLREGTCETLGEAITSLQGFSASLWLNPPPVRQPRSRQLA